METKRGSVNKVTANNNDNNNATVTSNAKSSSNSRSGSYRGKAQTHHSRGGNQYRGGGRGRGRGRGRAGSSGRKGRGSSHNVNTNSISERGKNNATGVDSSNSNANFPINRRGSKDEIIYTKSNVKGCSSSSNNGKGIRKSSHSNSGGTGGGVTKTALGNVIPSSNSQKKSNGPTATKKNLTALGNSVPETSNSRGGRVHSKSQRHSHNISAKQSQYHANKSQAEAIKSKETSAAISSLQKHHSNLSWIDMDDEGGRSSNDRNNRLEATEPEQISAGARAIAQLQEKVNKLTRENMALRDSVSLQKMNLEKEAKKSADLSAALDRQSRDYGMLENINTSLGKVRTRLEAEKESYRVKLLKSERERKEVQAKLSGGGKGKSGGHSKEETNDMETKIKKLELELENKQSLLDSAERKSAALKIDIEYHQAQEEYHKIRLENMEAEIKSKDEELKKMKSLRSNKKLEALTSKTSSSCPSEHHHDNVNREEVEGSNTNTDASVRASSSAVETKEEKEKAADNAKDKRVNKNQDVEIPSDNIISSNVITKLVL